MSDRKTMQLWRCVNCWRVVAGPLGEMPTHCDDCERQTRFEPFAPALGEPSGEREQEMPVFTDAAIRRLLEDAKPNLKAKPRDIQIYRACVEREIETALVDAGIEPTLPTSSASPLTKAEVIAELERLPNQTMGKPPFYGTHVLPEGTIEKEAALAIVRRLTEPKCVYCGGKIEEHRCAACEEEGRIQPTPPASAEGVNANLEKEKSLRNDCEWCHAACLSIAEGVSGWRDCVEASLAIKAVKKLRGDYELLVAESAEPEPYPRGKCQTCGTRLPEHTT